MEGGVAGQLLSIRDVAELLERRLCLLAVEIRGPLEEEQGEMKSFWFETLLRKRSAACQRWA